MKYEHSFHIPVMGIGFTLDTPMKVSQYGMASAISLVDDMLIEKLRQLYSEKFDIPYKEISNRIEDFRALRITSYLNLVQTMVIALDQRGNILLANPKACQVLEYQREELLGKNWFDTCLPKSSIADVESIFEKAMASNVSSIEYHVNPILSKSGEERIIAWNNTDLLDDNGNIAGILSSGEDITELINAEMRLNALLDISSCVTHESMQEDPLQIVSDQIFEKIGPAQGVTIWLYEEQNDQLAVKAFTGYQNESIINLSVDLDIYVVGHSFSNGTTIAIDDVSKIPNFSNIVDYPLEMDKIKCFICAPLKYHEKIFGVICIDNFDRPNAFSEDDRIFLESIANQLSGVIENTELFSEVQKNREDLRALSSRLVTIHENERKMIAMDLHDHFGQILTTLKLSLRADSFINKTEQEQRERLSDVSEIVDELLESAEDLSLRLRPSMLDDLGIEKAFNWHFKRQAKQTGVPITATIDLEKGKRYPDQIELTLYRVMEESLTNAIRHASPTKIEIEISENNHNILMKIKDNGNGFNLSSLKTSSFEHTGITGIRERINALSGNYAIQSKDGKGTTIEVTIPLASPMDKPNK